MHKNYYQTLGLEPNASTGEIKRAYRMYASKFHPDKQDGDEFFEERFKEILEAYQILSDEEKRTQYDLLLNGQQTINNEIEGTVNDQESNPDEKKKRFVINDIWKKKRFDIR